VTAGIITLGSQAFAVALLLHTENRASAGLPFTLALTRDNQTAWRCLTALGLEILATLRLLVARSTDQLTDRRGDATIWSVGRAGAFPSSITALPRHLTVGALLTGWAKACTVGPMIDTRGRQKGDGGVGRLGAGITGALVGSAGGAVWTLRFIQGQEEALGAGLAGAGI